MALSKRELNERIDGVLKAMFPSDAKPLVKQAHVEAGREHIKQLLYDVIQAVTPKKINYTLYNELGERCDIESVDAHNHTIDTIQESTKNLLGEK